MQKRFGVFAAVAATGLSLALVVATPAALGSNRSFKAHLTGAQEAPDPVDSQAQGQLNLRLSADGTTLSYKLIVANLDDVTAAHLHLGVVGMAGPPVAFLFEGDPSGAVNGVLSEGTITAADLIGPYAGEPLSTLIDAIEDGDIYVNVHTTAHPPGEIRGQVRS
jgi:hypothetical protein